MCLICSSGSCRKRPRRQKLRASLNPLLPWGRTLPRLFLRHPPRRPRQRLLMLPPLPLRPGHLPLDQVYRNPLQLSNNIRSREAGHLSASGRRAPSPRLDLVLAPRQRLPAHNKSQRHKPLLHPIMHLTNRLHIQCVGSSEKESTRRTLVCR